MPLDLQGSHAKVERAREHYDCLKSDINKDSAENGPPFEYIVSSEKDSGIHEVRLRAGPFSNLRYSAIVGDLVHNLRSALDYIVVSLVDASGSTLTTNHQFPIFDDPINYAKAAPKMLRGIVHGLREIEALQPYHRSPPKYDPLFQLNYFSNSDKHRLISQRISWVSGTSGMIDPQEGIINKEVFEQPEQWQPNDEVLIARITYRKPFPDPKTVQVSGQITLAEAFAAAAFGKHSRGFAVPLEFFKVACDHVSMIVDRFEKL